MENENENEELEKKNDQELSTSDYIKAIEKLKANSVSKEEFDKINEEKRQLLNAIVEGEKIKVDQDSPKTRSEIEERVHELQDNVFNKQENGLKFWQDALELRELRLKETGIDIFEPHGTNIEASDEDKESIKNLVEVVQECIDKAEGDDEYFSAELNRRTKDTPRR